MKLLIAGSGKIVQDWLTITKDLKETQLCGITATTRSLAKMQKFASEYGIEEVYTDYDTALKETSADTVYVAVINSLHFEFAKKALLTGKNVICEKPFTVTLEEFLELKKIALDKKLVLVEAITNQYLPNFYLLKKKIKTLGKIRIVSMNYSQYSSRYDAFKKGEILPAFDPKKAGGALMDLNIYNIHLLVGLFGKPKNAKYYANMQRGIDTSGILFLDYGDFKAVLIAAKDAGAPITSTIEGEEKSIVINGPTGEIKSFDLFHNSDHLEHVEKEDYPHRMYDEFVKFEKIIAKHDMKEVEQILDHSEDVMRVLDLAKKSTKAED